REKAGLAKRGVGKREVNLPLVKEQGGVAVVGDPLADQRRDKILALMLVDVGEEFFGELPQGTRVELFHRHDFPLSTCLRWAWSSCYHTDSRQVHPSHGPR